MKRVVVLLLVFWFIFFSTSSYAFTCLNGEKLDDTSFGNPSGGSWAPANVDTPSRITRTVDLKALYEEFQKFWYVKDKDDLQNRFEEFLKSKNIYTKEIDDYDDFMEVWIDNYDEDLDFDDLYDIYDLGLSDTNDPDDYDVLVDDDIDELYDDYLDDYIDEEYYEDFGEYFDEVYYD